MTEEYFHVMNFVLYACFDIEKKTNKRKNKKQKCVASLLFTVSGVLGYSSPCTPPDCGTSGSRGRGNGPQHIFGRCTVSDDASFRGSNKQHSPGGKVCHFSVAWD